MKKTTTIFLLMLCAIITNAQSNLGVGTATPDASAKLDITSSTQGILVPRMTTTNRTAIATPAKGLMVYDSTAKAFYYHNGTTWNAVGGTPTTQLPNAFMPHATTTSANYITPFISASNTTLNVATTFLVSNNCTLNLTFYANDDEGVTYQLFEVAPVSGAVAYATTGTALASCATTAWTSGAAISASLSYAATAGKLYTIKVTPTAGGNFGTSGGYHTAFYVN